MAELPRQVSWRHIARHSPGAIAFGALVGWGLARFEWEPRTILVGGFIGWCCYMGAMTAELLFWRWFEERPDAWWRRAIAYFVASQISWPVGLYVGILLIFQQWPSKVGISRAGWIAVVGAGTLGTLGGLVIVAYDRLKTRLATSIEQLKEAEFAEKELELAREFQSRMLPAAEVAADGYRISSRNFAARYVAGDFYDIFSHADGAVGIAVADVAGKGLAASLIMASVKSVLALLAGSRDVNRAIEALNEKLVGELSKREFVALVLARYEPATGLLSITNAGLPDPYVVRADRSLETVSVTGARLPLGVRREMSYDKADVALAPGDAVVFLSDGLPEASMANGEPLGYEELAAIVQNVGADADGILAAVQRVTAEVREDDQTIVVLRRVS
jgi:sigma-B regulation protein RsbU (phosphoserine phosphatase)